MGNQHISMGRRVLLTALLAVTLILLAVLATSFSGSEQTGGGEHQTFAGSVAP